jgi:hypothetical protein
VRGKKCWHRYRSAGRRINEKLIRDALSPELSRDRFDNFRRGADMNVIRVLVLFAVLAFPAGAASANLLGSDDYDGLRDLAKRTFTLGKDITPVPGTPVATSLCLIDLNKNLEKFHDKLDPLVSLVGLASVMADSADEMAVIHILSIEVPSFLESLEASRRGITSMVGDAIPDLCRRNSAVAVTAQKILSIYGDAASLVGPIIEKIGARSR